MSLLSSNGECLCHEAIENEVIFEMTYSSTYLGKEKTNAVRMLDK